MNTSKLFINAILNLVNNKIYSVDFAILIAEELYTKNRLTEQDYTDLLLELANRQVVETEEVPTEEFMEGETYDGQ